MSTRCTHCSGRFVWPDDFPHAPERVCRSCWARHYFPGVLARPRRRWWRR